MVISKASISVSRSGSAVGRIRRIFALATALFTTVLNSSSKSFERTVQQNLRATTTPTYFNLPSREVMAPPKSYAETVRQIRGPRDSGVAFDVNIRRMKAVGDGNWAEYISAPPPTHHIVVIVRRHHGATEVICRDCLRRKRSSLWPWAAPPSPAPFSSSSLR